MELILSVNDILNFALAGAGAAAGIYGAIRAWRSNMKMKQIEAERLSSKLSIDFTYDLIKSGETNLCRGVIGWTNLGLTNIKIIKLNIDIRDREDELRESFLPSDGNLKSEYIPFTNKIEHLEIEALNNHKLVNFSNDFDKGEVKIFQDDPIYGLALSSKEKRKLKDKAEEVDSDIFEIKKNISNYIDAKINKLIVIFSNKDREGFKKHLIKFLFSETLVRELRGIQLFPQEKKEQEFYVKYKGEGIVYLNVETATIRLQLKNIAAFEEYKSLGDKILDLEELPDLIIKKFRNLLTLIVSPTSLEIHKHKSNYLLYLN
ncbi:hypothetical protein LCGC14_0749000 [marine sediment metagenome]|uniref:Uncharacterized protein n=1 Tax=marine sediment metagenome TaxID=412755 RepID=A0A0F9Q8T0_9ZZZZ